MNDKHNLVLQLSPRQLSQATMWQLQCSKQILKMLVTITLVVSANKFTISTSNLIYKIKLLSVLMLELQIKLLSVLMLEFNIFFSQLLPVLVLQTVEGDFHIGFSLQFYSHPTNSLADGLCCEKTCTSCNTVLHFCFRDSQHSHEDTNRDTCFLDKERDTTSVFTFLADLTSSVNANFTVSHAQRLSLIHI